MEEPDGATLFKDSVNGNYDAVRKGNPTYQKGYCGNGSLHLETGDDYLEVDKTKAPVMTGSMTIAAWILFNGTNNQFSFHNLISKRTYSNRSWQLGVSEGAVEGQKATFTIAISQTADIYRSSSDDLPLDTWVHIAGVYDSTKPSLDVYLNGSLSNGALGKKVVNTVSDALDSEIPTMQFDSMANPLHIGTAGFANSTPFAGTIDDLRVYDKALTQAQIQELL